MRIGSITAAAKRVKIRETAARADSKHNASAARSALRSRAVEVAIAALHKPSLRISPIRVTERVKIRQRLPAGSSKSSSQKQEEERKSFQHPHRRIHFRSHASLR